MKRSIPDCLHRFGYLNKIKPQEAFSEPKLDIYLYYRRAFVVASLLESALCNSTQAMIKELILTLNS